MSPEAVDKRIGDRIRSRRVELGLTQEQLTASLNVSYQQIQKYEAGANRISAIRLFALARRMEVPIGYFFEGLADGGGMAETSVEDGGRQRATLELIRSYAEIKDDDVRLSIVGLVKAVAERQA